MWNDYRRYIGLLSVIVAGVLLAVVLADGGLRVKKLLDEPKSDQQNTGKQAAKPVKTAPYRVSEITRIHLFGHESKKTAPKPKEVKASKTTLKLDLVGVIASVDPNMARALISPNKRKIKSYAIGEIIDSTDAKLFAVESDNVTLERNGKFETLSMQRRAIGDVPDKTPHAGKSSGRTLKASNINLPATEAPNSARKQWRSRFVKRRPPNIEDFKKNGPQEKSKETQSTAEDLEKINK